MKLYFENVSSDTSFTLVKGILYGDVREILEDPSDSLDIMANGSTDNIDEFISMFKRRGTKLYIPAGTELEPAQSKYPSYYQAFRFAGSNIEFNIQREDARRMKLYFENKKRMNEDDNSQVIGKRIFVFPAERMNEDEIRSLSIGDEFYFYMGQRFNDQPVECVVTSKPGYKNDFLRYSENENEYSLTEAEFKFVYKKIDVNDIKNVTLSTQVNYQNTDEQSSVFIPTYKNFIDEFRRLNPSLIIID